MSPDELLNTADIELHSLSASLSRDELQKLFDAIWERVRPLYAGQPKSIESAHGLALSQAALSVASHGGDRRLLIEAWHMMGRSLSANEEFERAIPFYEQVISALEDGIDAHQAARRRLARRRLALIGVLLKADRYNEAFYVVAGFGRRRGIAERRSYAFVHAGSFFRCAQHRRCNRLV